MKKRTWKMVLCLLLGTLTFLSACGDDRLVQSGVLPDSDGAKEITVSAWLSDYDVKFFENIARNFEKDTGVKVTIENHSKEQEYRMAAIEASLSEDGMGQDVEEFGRQLESATESLQKDLERYRQQTATELMAGSGADVFVTGYIAADGNNAVIDFQNMGRRGLLCNMSEWAANEPTLSGDVIFENILRAAEYDEDALYMLPVSFAPGLYIGSTEENAPVIDTRMTWRQFFETVGNTAWQGVLWPSNTTNMFHELFNARAHEFMDVENNTENLNSPEMVALLNECATWRDLGYYADERDLAWGTSWDQSLYIAESYGHDLYPHPSNFEEGVRGDIFVTELCGINSNSEYRRTAWEFIKFLLSEEMQSAYTFMYSPVNKNAFETKMRRDIATYNGDVSDAEKADADLCIPKSMELLDTDEKVFFPHYSYSIVYGIATEFFLDKITAEQAAQQMSEEVGLYLKEQS